MQNYVAFIFNMYDANINYMIVNVRSLTIYLGDCLKNLIINNNYVDTTCQIHQENKLIVKYSKVEVYIIILILFILIPLGNI